MAESEPQPVDPIPVREIVVATTTKAAPNPVAAQAVQAHAPSRQLAELPRDELGNLAEGLGLDPTEYKTQQALVVAVHERRQLIAGLDRQAMLDVVRWGRRPVTISAGKEQIAQEIARIRSMKFAGLTHRGLVVLARLRGIDDAGDGDAAPLLVRKLKKQEGFFSRLNRRRRAMLGGVVATLVGENVSKSDYQFLPEPGETEAASARPASIKDEIEESGLFGGISNRLKKSADVFLNQKLDEIENRIDRKLDEIDRRLAEWRDKEIANRIKILKITLWASVIVGIVSLIYAYVTEYLVKH
jgi:hypothetical protein